MHRATTADFEPSDAALVARLATDPECLEAFYRRHVVRVTEFAARRSHTAGDVADVVSVTFMKAISGAHTFDAKRCRGSAQGWLLGIALNEIREQARRNQRQAALMAREGSRRLLDESDMARMERLIDAQRLAPSLQSALSQISPMEREALLLVAVDGYSSREAATALGLPSTVFRARLSRAKRHLRGLISMDDVEIAEIIGAL